MKSSKAQIMSKFHKIPEIRFEDQQITSFSGLLIFQLFFTKINLKQQLKNCFSHLKVSPIFGRHFVVLLLIVHLLLGFRRLREVDYYKAKKGARSYYPLFCTVAQTDQFFDVYHRPGNVHDSNGAAQFMLNCFEKAKQELKATIFESRMDSAFFNEEKFRF